VPEETYQTAKMGPINEAEVNSKDTIVLLSDGTFLCSVCEAIFDDYRKGYKHYRSHLKLFCELCEKSFSSNFNYKRHMNYHAGAYKCEICNKKFDRVLYLENHNKQVHKIAASNTAR